MPGYEDFNARIIDEFRANDGAVGAPFEGAPLTLVHHRGRSSGRQHVSPMMYMRLDEPDVIYVFATKGGSAEHPEWYHNLVEAGEGVVEVGSETYPVTVTDLVGDERDRVYAEQASRYPNFGEYQEKTAGVRIIPVLALRRA